MSTGVDEVHAPGSLRSTLTPLPCHEPLQNPQNQVSVEPGPAHRPNSTLNHRPKAAYAEAVVIGVAVPTKVHPEIDPLLTSTSTYRDGNGRQRRLRVVAVPKPFDPQRFAEVLIAAATAQILRERTVCFSKRSI